MRDTHNRTNDMANELKQLETFEISLVPKGANKKKFMVRKSEGGLNMDTKEIEEILNTEVPDEDAIALALKEAKVEKATDKQMSVISGAVRLLNSIKEGFPNLGSIINRLAKLGDAKPADKGGHTDEDDKMKAKKKEDAAKDEIKKQDISSLSPEVQASIKAVMKSNEDLLARVNKTEESNKALVDEIETKKFVTKAEELTDLGIEADEFGPVLKELSEKAPEAFEKLQPILEAASKTIKKSAFREIGSSSSNGGSAWAKIEKMAEEAASKDNTITKEQAAARILKSDEGKKLMQDYRDEKGGQ